MPKMVSPNGKLGTPAADKGPKAPLIQVTQIVHPDDDDHHAQPSPHKLVNVKVPTIGIDNPVFDLEDDFNLRGDDDFLRNEQDDIHMPLPNTPFSFRRGSNSSMFEFDPECASLFSRRGSYSSELDTPGITGKQGYPRRASYGQPLTANNKSNLTVPSWKQLRVGEAIEGNGLRPSIPGFIEGDLHIPPPSPGVVSTSSAWSELLNIAPSRKSSDAGQSEYSRISNVSSSLSEHLRYLVRAFSSRTEKVKETTLQPPSPSSLSDYAGSDALSAISTEPQFRRRLDSYFPDQAEGDTISEIVRFREEQEQEKQKKFFLPRWIRRLKFPHVIEPQSKLYLLWLFVVTLAFMYNAWAISLRVSFPYQTPENVKYWLICDYVCDGIYILDILLFKMRISFLNSGLKETHRSKTRANYFKKLIFRFDCLSLLPLDLLYLINMRVNVWCRLPRLLKIQTFWEFYSRCDHLVRSAHAVRIMKTFTYMLFLIHIETCGYYTMSVYEGIGINQWVYNGQGNAYIRCFYLATKTATSIGNNPKPTNTIEYMFMTVYWVSGVFVFALLIGQIRDIVDAANMVKTTYTHRMDNALNYLKNVNLPQESQDRIRTWFIYNWQQQKVIDERTMMDALPLKLRKDLAIHVHFNTLSKVKLFCDCDKTLLFDLVLKLRPILYLPGDYVCRKGEIGKEMYIVSQGVVEVVGGPNNSLVLATLREGSVFGEISLLAIAAEGNRRTADVRCKGFTNLFILSKHDFEAAMKDYPEAHKLLKKRARKLLRMNARIERQSQTSMDNTKIKATAIIRTPPETPKMVKTVLQVMNPDSTIVRHLISHDGHKSVPASRRASEKSETGSGNDNQAYVPGSEYNIAAKHTSIDYSDAEVFYDEILSRSDWTAEKLELENELKQQQASGNPDDDGDVDDHVTDGSKSQKTSDSTCGSGELVQELIDDEEHEESPTLDGYNYTRAHRSISEDSLASIHASSDATSRMTITADMFGDIESHDNSKSGASSAAASSDYRPRTLHETVTTTTGRKSCLSRNIREDEYAHSLANGFTIIIDSVDDNDDMMANFSDDEEEDDELHRSRSRRDDCVSVVKNVSFQSDTKYASDSEDDGDAKFDTKKASVDSKGSDTVTIEHETKHPANPTITINKSTDDNDTDPSEISQLSKETIKEQTKGGFKKKLPFKPTPPGKSKITSKNKLGLKLKIDTEVTHNLTPYLKASATKMKSQTNKARQLHSASSSKQQKRSNGAIPSGSRANSRPSTGTGIGISTNEHKTSDHVGLQASGDKPVVISVIGADSMDAVNNTNDVTMSKDDNNQITCIADVHREKSLSPKVETTSGETASIQVPEASERQRKISVISIGSVLKDGRETLV